MSSAASSSWTENTLCLNARRSTEARKSDSSLRVARGSPLSAFDLAEMLANRPGGPAFSLRGSFPDCGLTNCCTAANVIDPLRKFHDLQGVSHGTQAPTLSRGRPAP